jgi:hypothetical protein
MKSFGSYCSQNIGMQTLPYAPNTWASLQGVITLVLKRIDQSL